MATANALRRYHFRHGITRRLGRVSEETLPGKLRDDQSTAPGIWAKIIVNEGKLIYRVDALNATSSCLPARRASSFPRKHRVEPVGRVRLFVEF